MNPIFADWDGNFFKPLKRFSKICENELTIGDKYQIEIVEKRSLKSHNFYFARLQELFMNLPESIADEFPSVEHLRKYALIKAGYHKTWAFSLEENGYSSSLKAMVKTLDEYAIILSDGSQYQVYTAKSQSMKEMGKDEFNKSKQAVLEVIEAMIEGAHNG